MKIKVSSILGFMLITIFIVSSTSMVHAITELSVPPTIQVGSAPEYAAYDAKQRRNICYQSG